jgi:bifunctional non-homologous end joining protein LigD
MTLKIYRLKRDFKKTAEPKGVSKKKSSKQNLYIIQKHAASHLHYDFRLELNGTLLSWAVPKGPCLDPKVKRLAMHVEDHPVEYGSFQGTIPKGQYGGGTVMLWDKGTWHCEDDNPTESYKKGKLTFTLKAKKLNGRWKLFRINKDDKTWLLVKADDEFTKPLSKYDILKKEPNSVINNITLDEISSQSAVPKKSKTSKSIKPTDASDTLKVAKSLKKQKKLAKPSKKSPQNLTIDMPITAFPKKISPQLATLVDEPPSGDNWVHEIKYDGYRLIGFKNGKSVMLQTRNHHDWTDKFPNIKKALASLKVKTAVFDGEVVVLDEKGKSDFQELQHAISEGEDESGSRTFVYYIFDLLYYDKYDLTSLPLMERKKFLKQVIVKDTAAIRYGEHLTGSAKNILAETCKLGLEGIVSKDTTAPYVQRRNTAWLKSKCNKRQEFIICGLVAPQAGKRELFRSLMLGSYNAKHELIYHGNVGTGFTQASIKEIYTKLKKHETDAMPFKKKPPGSKNAVWLKPIVVAEIEFTEWTNNETLRHPSFKGFRADKPANTIGKEKPVTLKKIPPSKNTPNLTHPDKILYPKDKITKQDIYDYYEAIQDWILPYIINRPLTLVRCPETFEKCFYQKHTNNTTPPSLFTFRGKKNSPDNCIYIKNSEGLLVLPQMGTLEIHPWGSRIEEIEKPDIIVFDLDPAPDVTWKAVVAAAFEVKQHLADFKLQSFVKTTGGKGLHIVIPIKPQYNWSEIKNFTHVFVDYLVQINPKKYIGEMSKAKRTGKIFIDYLRNQRGATAVAPYSTRAREHAPVATPLHWDELTNKFNDTYYTIKTIMTRLADVKDPWKKFFTMQQSLNLDKLSE